MSGHPFVKQLIYLRASRDEFADIKSVKLLRRGRRLQEVEEVYGKAHAKGASSSSTSLSSSSDHQKRQSIIPPLDAKFFASPFFTRFDIQRASLAFARIICVRLSFYL
jgi:hypothetical protein